MTVARVDEPSEYGYAVLQYSCKASVVDKIVDAAGAGAAPYGQFEFDARVVDRRFGDKTYCELVDAGPVVSYKSF